MTDPTSLPFFPLPDDDQDGPGPGPDDLVDRVVRALDRAGLPSRVDEDGDVVVEVDEQVVFLRCVDSAPPMVRVFGQWLVDQDLPGGELAQLRAANALTGALNLLKVTVHQDEDRQDRLSVAVDLLVPPGLDLEPLLTASVDAVVGAVHTWHLTVLEIAGLEPG